MSLFKNKINIETGQVFSLKDPNKEIGTYKNKKGYKILTKFFDCYGNKYNNVHQVIIAEGLQLPKHLWPIDEKGERYVPDHITPVSNGGTNAFSNLHLIPRPDNNRNEQTRVNVSNSLKGKHHSEKARKKMSEAKKGIVPKCNPEKTVYQYTLDGKLVGVYKSTVYAAKTNGFNQRNISGCCLGKRKTAHGFRWSYKPLKND